MLVTRPEPEAHETAARLHAIDIEPTLLPLLVRTTLPTSLPDSRGFAAMAITSANALHALAERGALETYRGLKVFAVGDKCATHARAFGFTAVESAGGTLADLVELLAHSGLGGPIFYPAARQQSGDLAKSLAPYGVMAVTARVYEMVPIAELPPDILMDLTEARIEAALFYSRRTAETFVGIVGDRLPRAARSRLAMLCLSEAVAEPLINAHFVRVGLADHPSEEAMMTLALSFARDQSAP